MHSRLATCVVLVVGCALLAIPAQPPAMGNQDQLRIVACALGKTNPTLPQVAFGRINSAAKCNGVGLPCDFHGYPCCPGLKCVFRGGSTRVGYQCRPGGSENASTGAFWEELSANKLDHDDLTEVLR